MINNKFFLFQLVTLQIGLHNFSANHCLPIITSSKAAFTFLSSAIRPAQLPQLMQTMRNANIILPTRCLFMWQLLTISRPAEAAEARWDEIDFDAKEWKIPAARMKMNRDHTVPLGSRGLSLAQLSGVPPSP